MTKEQELKKAVKECIRLYKKYYSHNGGTDILPACHIAKGKVEALNKKVARVMDNATFFYIEYCCTYQQAYHIIDYMCGTALETTEEDSNV